MRVTAVNPAGRLLPQRATGLWCDSVKFEGDQLIRLGEDLANHDTWGRTVRRRGSRSQSIP